MVHHVKRVASHAKVHATKVATHAKIHANKANAKILAEYKKALNRFTSSDRFKKMVEKTYKSMDMDDSGHLDNTEIYCGVLLLYTKVGGRQAALDPLCCAACRPTRPAAMLLPPTDRRRSLHGCRPRSHPLRSVSISL